jgi:hypothetical protein
MGKLYTELDERLRGFIKAQRLFFVATAPSGPDGHVNCSPKGLDTLLVLGATTVAYLDYVGSGVETIAHLRENGRIVIMFCAFEGPPRIVRLHGQGEVIEPSDEGFAALAAQFPDSTGARSIIRVHVNRISDSCGYGVPLYRYEGERSQLKAWAERKGPQGLLEYQRENNLESIDRLPGLRTLAK